MKDLQKYQTEQRKRVGFDLAERPSVSYHRHKQWNHLEEPSLSLDLRCALSALRSDDITPGGAVEGVGAVHSLTHTGRNIVQTGLQNAAPLLGTVSDVCLQERNAKLPFVHHANQAAPGLARALPYSTKHTQCKQAVAWN